MASRYEAHLFGLRAHEHEDKPPEYPKDSRLIQWPTPILSKLTDFNSDQGNRDSLLSDYRLDTTAISSQTDTRVGFKIQPQYTSWLDFTISGPLKESLGSQPSARVKLHRGACVRVEFRKISKAQYETGSNEWLEDKPGHRFYLVMIECTPDRLCTEGLFVHDGPLFLQPLRDFFRSTAKFGMLIKASSDLEDPFTSLLTMFSEEVRSDPVDPWRQSVQHSLRLQKPSSFTDDPTLAYFDWKDYCTRLGVAATAVEAEEGKPNVEVLDCALRIIQKDDKNEANFLVLFAKPAGLPKDFFSEGDRAVVSFEKDGNDVFRVPDKSRLPDEAELPDNFRLPDISTPPEASTPSDNFELPDGGDVDDSDSESEFDGSAALHGAWNLKIIPRLPFCTDDYLAASLQRRRDPSTNKYYDERVLPTVTLPDNLDKSSLKTNFLSRTTTKISKVFPISRHGIFPYVFAALRKLNEKYKWSSPTDAAAWDGGLLQVLLGFRVDESIRKNIYQSLDDPTLANPDDMKLNESQKKAIRMALDALAGFVLAQGAAGTGKSHFVAEALTPFFRDKTRVHRLLVTSAANSDRNSLATVLHERLEGLIAKGEARRDAYVICQHAIKSEDSVVLSTAILSRERVLKERKSKPLSAVPHTMATESPLRSTVQAHMHTFTTSRHEGVEDERVVLKDLSLGHRMLQVAGIVPGAPFAAVDQFAKCKQLYEDYAKGMKFTKEDWESLKSELDQLKKYTIRNATVLCATIAGAADRYIWKNYGDAELIVIDEGAHIPEYQTWPLLAFYPKAVGKIIVFDPQQLRPFFKNNQDKSKPKVANPFKEQMGMSLPERLQSLGYPTAFFDTQYRAEPDIATLYNKVSYGGRLQNDPSMWWQTDPLAKAILQHNRVNYGVEKAVVFFDVEGAEEAFTPDKSRFCEHYAHVVMNVLQTLMEAGFGTPARPCSIAILTAYAEQRKLLRKCKDDMAESPSYQKVTTNVDLRTVDSVQGMQYDIVIVDPVIVRRSPGFFTKNRLNVLFSRARLGLYVVGCYDGWSRFSRADSLPLRAYAKQLVNYRTNTAVGTKYKSKFVKKEFVPEVESDSDW